MIKVNDFEMIEISSRMFHTDAIIFVRLHKNWAVGIEECN